MITKNDWFFKSLGRKRRPKNTPTITLDQIEEVNRLPAEKRLAAMKKLLAITRTPRQKQRDKL